MELRINDYVRTNWGDIDRIVSLKNNEVIVDIQKDEEGREYCKSCYKEDIKLSSPQIIDLIEEDDYIRIITDTDFRRIYNSYGKLVIYRGKELPIETFSNKFIGEIITHEQMEAIQYRVEE